MTTPRRTVSVLGVLTVLALGSVLLIGACEVPVPIALELEETAETSQSADVTVPEETLQAVFGPGQWMATLISRPDTITSGVSILNLSEVVAAMQAVDAGVGGTARILLFIDFDGTVQEMRLTGSSGRYSLDSAAMSVAEVFRFSPAMNREEAVPVWVSIPITFEARSVG